MNRLSLQTKLLGALGAGLALVLMCALGGLAYGWSRVSDEVPDEVALAAQSTEMSQEFSTQVQEWKNVLIRGHDPEQREKYLKAFNEQHAKVQALAAGQAERVADREAQRLAAQFAGQHRELHTRYLAGYAEFEAAGFETRVGDKAVKGVDREPTKTLRALIDRNQTVADAAVAARARQARQGLMIAAVLTTVAALSLIGLIGLWIRHTVLRPIRNVAEVARRVSHGDLDAVLEVRSQDEVGALAQAMQQVTGTLQQFAEAQSRMAERHDAGEMSYRIAADTFDGVYRTMAENTNALVSAQTELIETMLATVQAYATGNMQPDMPRLPGEKAAITEALDAVKRSLGAISAEIQRLVDSAAEGDFSLRGNAAAFHHDFREMVLGLNRLMEGTESGLAQVSIVLRAMADGDLTASMQGEHRGVFASIRNDASTTVARLTRIVRDIRDGAHSINAAASEIAAGNNDLSQRTEQQAAALEETTSSMQELTSTVRRNAEDAQQAGRIAGEAARAAGSGGHVIVDVERTMERIREASQRVAEIIAVIDGIAFQTNILALNAAVEAARAGEQGRGFAVVASEVRALAQRSASAARDVKQLIGESTGRVAEGARLVDQAGSTMREVVDSVDRMTGLMSDIAAASSEQAAGIAQVNHAIAHMDEGTQQNAALVEEASASARSLEQQAEQLVATVAAFRIDAEPAAGTARPPRAARGRAAGA